MYSQSHRNPDDPTTEPAAPPPPPRAMRSPGGGLGKTILIAGLGAVAGAFAIDMYNKMFKGKGKDDDGGDGAQPPQQVITPQVHAPAVIPMPMPYPTPMPGWGGGWGPQQQLPERNTGKNSDQDRVAAVKGRRNAMDELRAMKQSDFDKLCERFMEGDD